MNLKVNNIVGDFKMNLKAKKVVVDSQYYTVENAENNSEITYDNAAIGILRHNAEGEKFFSPVFLETGEPFSMTSDYLKCATLHDALWEIEILIRR